MIERAVLWGKTELVRLEHLPARQVTRIVDRRTARLLAEVPGHPTAPETHEALARTLQNASEGIRRDHGLLRPVYSGIQHRRGAAA
jgi:hypothetical protein